MLFNILNFKLIKQEKKFDIIFQCILIKILTFNFEN